MDLISLEFSAYRIAGTDRLERSFYPRVETIYPDSRAIIHLQGMLFPNQMVTLRLDSPRPVRPGLLTAEMMINDINGTPVGPSRPVLINTLACDTPLYSTHIATDPEFGVFSVGIRSPRSAWLATEESGAEENPS